MTNKTRYELPAKHDVQVARSVRRLSSLSGNYGATCHETAPRVEEAIPKRGVWEGGVQPSENQGGK